MRWESWRQGAISERLAANHTVVQDDVVVAQSEIPERACLGSEDITTGETTMYASRKLPLVTPPTPDDVDSYAEE